MKTYGDLTPMDILKVKELEKIEEYLVINKETILPTIFAKGMVAMSADYYDMDMEERGDELIIAAEHAYPGYFLTAIYDQMAEDSDYHQLVNLLKSTEGYGLMTDLGFNDGQI